MTSDRGESRASPFFISTLCREGIRAKNASWTLYAMRNKIRTDRMKMKLAFPAGQVRGSVVRNRIRRRIREALRKLWVKEKGGWDFFLVVRKVPTGSFATLQGQLQTLLRQVGYLP